MLFPPLIVFLVFVAIAIYFPELAAFAVGALVICVLVWLLTTGQMRRKGYHGEETRVTYGLGEGLAALVIIALVVLWVTSPSTPQDGSANASGVYSTLDMLGDIASGLMGALR